MISSSCFLIGSWPVISSLRRQFNSIIMQDKQQYREITEGAAKILFKEEKDAKD